MENIQKHTNYIKDYSTELLTLINLIYNKDDKDILESYVRDILITIENIKLRI